VLHSSRSNIYIDDIDDNCCLFGKESNHRFYHRLSMFHQALSRQFILTTTSITSPSRINLSAGMFRKSQLLNACRPAQTCRDDGWPMLLRRASFKSAKKV